MPPVPTEQQSPYGLTATAAPRRRRRRANIARRRQGGDGDDGEADDGESGTIVRRLDSGGSGPVPPTNLSPHQRHGDRGSDDSANGEPGVILRFRDLKRRQIVRNWPTLLRWIRAEGFPVGVQLGPNSRGWLEADVIAWLRSRPVAGAKAERQRAHSDP